jgi:hypothetical protein
VSLARRAHSAIGAAWPEGAPGYLLLGLLLTGTALRVIAIFSWWPVTTTLGDNYEAYTANPFDNPLHPAGYSTIMTAVGLVTREVAVLVFLQHLSGIAAALLLWAATRRITGSAWPGLLPAGIVLLDPDFIFLEHSIMSESWFLLAISAGLYAAARALDDPAPYWRWPLLTGVALSLAVTIRSAALLLIPVAILALLLCRPWSSGSHSLYLRSAVGVFSVALVMLLGFATANATFGQRFALGASPGWYLYARAAQFADCAKFNPPPGTDVLCEDRPASERQGTRYYSFDPGAPGPDHFGNFGNDDDRVGQWARRAILAQPGDYLENVWANLRGYWLPGLRPKDSTLSTDPWEVDQGLDPQLAFTNGLSDSGDFRPLPDSSHAAGRRTASSDLGFAIGLTEGSYRRSLEGFFNGFTPHLHPAGLEFLGGWQRIARFGATALSIATILTLLGLAFGTRRSRIGVLLFGIGGLTLLVAPSLTANYWGRYTVPLAGPLMAGAAIAIAGFWSSRRRSPEATDRPSQSSA